ncbi:MULTISPECIES: FAD binding domain-containing protein [unclassified Bradyrhizobium]|uniref:FAD binding domain-containing protein n=1 Tax=unclassified Bradyrhizobium TaxID=2631580 RepID=UPI00102E6BE2|nr:MULTISPECIES: FAD binding domain-containing protein [unclassified Bradyrhizobium]MDI4233274.1 FAD binding domain-containing protein [Bradyrhizobium sp. Arg237L]TAI67953.1 carbon monoxide dehydrogenase [Bradyrhizobium sp. Leo170]
MKPAPFGYERPRDLPAALSLLAEANGASKIIAGGQSLGPMLNLRLVQPELVVDITGLAELKQAERRGDELVLGACITHADIEDGRTPDVTRGAMRGVAANIAYRAVRNRGTIGGSLSHADPAADWVSAFAAFGARLTLRSLAGARTVAMEDFILGALESILRPGEIVETIHVPARPASAHWGYVKSCRKTGEFAHALGAVMIDPSAATARVVMGAIDTTPIVISDAAELFGGRIAGDYKERFDVRVADALLAKAGIGNPADRHIHVSVLRRAVREAAA